ncbi:MAG: hypothetical protein HFF65_03765, partial [Oscillospiraceae bacterium]|nr:hypothetical protein [Oscillospiraceae bacterium]
GPGRACAARKRPGGDRPRSSPTAGPAPPWTQTPIFRGGELVYDLPALPDIRRYCLEQVDTLWEEVKRFDNPHKYYVDLSQRLWDVKHGLLEENG